MAKWTEPNKELLDALEWKEMSVPRPKFIGRVWARLHPKGETPFYVPCVVSETSGCFKAIGEDGFLMHHAPLEPFITHWANSTDQTRTPPAYRVHVE
jgi:hypothetical protein